MKNRYLYFIFYSIFFIIYFLLIKVYFIVANYDLFLHVSFLEIVKIFIHGFVMDLSATAYLVFLPGLLLTVSIIKNASFFLTAIRIYTIIIIAIISFIAVIDAELYHYWGFRLDITPLLYIKTPTEALASISIWAILRQLIIGIILFYVSYITFKRYIDRKDFEKVHFIYSPMMAIIVAALIIPIRGGLGVATINVGRVYFSDKNFLNHAGINIFWNVGFSLSEYNTKNMQYYTIDKKQVPQLVNGLMGTNNIPDSIVLKKQKTNVVLIIMESFTAKVIGSLGGRSGVTPNINQLSNEGILFTNFFANADRSDKGLVAILSGYPAQPTTSIIIYANKSHSLPRIPVSLKSVGYQTAFYYGGDINFANMRSYLVDSRFDKIVSMDSFPKSTYNSKWGAHDHVVFQKLYKDLCKSKQPFFSAYFTLSSHEPFEVPCKYMIGKDDDSRFMNSIHYTDSCVGDFVAKCKTQPWWNNTLIILVADHGHPLPGRTPNHASLKFRIPMLWLGGALKHPGVVSKYATQMDIASTLLHQMGLPSEKYSFSKDIFNAKQAGFGFFVFNNGFGFQKDSTGVVYDYGSRKILEDRGMPSETELNSGKAYLQSIYTDLDNR
jgi:phosphoglycerol transferase MdoB-like AlkP superfamily enzyme